MVGQGTLQTGEFWLRALVDSIMEKHMPVLPDLEVTEIGHHEWHIQDWRALERKTYSESWLLGGFRWYVQPEFIFLWIRADLLKANTPLPTG